jgi:hypothetical protein
MDKHHIIIIIIILLICYIYHIYHIYINYENKINNIIRIKKINLDKFIHTKLNNTYNKLFIVISPELGDNIIFNGAIRYFCTKYYSVTLVCKKEYHKQISYMYRDINNLLFYVLPNKYFFHNINYYIPINNKINNLLIKYNITYINQININHKNSINYMINHIITDNVKRNYNSIGLEKNIAYDYFKIVRNYESENILYNKLINIIGKKYVIVIDDEKRNFIINDYYINNIDLPIFKLSQNSKNNDKRLDSIHSEYVFDYIKILENADSIYSIDTSLLWLIDFLNINVNIYVYLSRIDNNIYNNKNIKKLKIYPSDIISSNLNINNYYLKYPYDLIKSIL